MIFIFVPPRNRELTIHDGAMRIAQPRKPAIFTSLTEAPALASASATATIVSRASVSASLHHGVRNSPIRGALLAIGLAEAKSFGGIPASTSHHRGVLESRAKMPSVSNVIDESMTCSKGNRANTLL